MMIFKNLIISIDSFVFDEELKFHQGKKNNFYIID